MDVIRNFIKVSGITGENELPSDIRGGLIQYSETETIHISDNKPAIQSIFQIIIQLDAKIGRIINTPFGSTIVLDGIKKLKIIYAENNDSQKVGFAHLEIPYNTFVELPKNTEINDNIKVYIIDAYFSLMDCKRIYSHILYMVYCSFTDKHHEEPRREKVEKQVRQLCFDGHNYKTYDEHNRDLVDIDSEYL